MRIPNEIKAGVLVLAAVAVGVFFFAKTASLKKETYDLNTCFSFAGNLKTDAVVKLSGLEVGRVREMGFTYDGATKVKCVLEIDASARVRKDSIAYIDVAGFVGDAFVGITAGSSEEFLAGGEDLASEEPIQTRIMMKKAEQIEDGLSEVLAQIKALIVDNRQNLDKIIVNIESVTENFEAFSDDIKKNPWKLLFKAKEQ